ncbi:hypothetical protein AVEN_188451-1 [Araneus ventricosus]|uniref:Uncharacterized protein n=1 Tax=Araneus ventricosus TaxID=182803 RepID=A0A4Y2H5J0_ARAVE|nr:hypothetical protein AVEN_188451-1 [Araneus ventricosus]
MIFLKIAALKLHSPCDATCFLDPSTHLRGSRGSTQYKIRAFSLVLVGTEGQFCAQERTELHGELLPVSQETEVSKGRNTSLVWRSASGETET